MQQTPQQTSGNCPDASTRWAVVCRLSVNGAVRRIQRPRGLHPVGQIWSLCASAALRW